MSSEEIKLTIYGEPVPQARPRFAGHAYDTTKSRNFKEGVQWQAIQQYKGKPLECPLFVQMDFYRSIQASGSKKKKQQKKDGLILPCQKPDVDNLYKSASDALTKIIWKDDNQIIGILATKHYDDGKGARIEIKVKRA